MATKKSFVARPSLRGGFRWDPGGRFSASAYEATETTNRRRAPTSAVKSEDDHLKGLARKTLVATTRDARRNFTAFRWALNKHLDFVVSHNFRARTGDRNFDRRLEKFVAKLSTKEFFDVTGRHPLRRWMRLFEASRVVDGDVLGVKIAGGYMQAIEGDRIRDPGPQETKEGEKWVNGLRISSFGSVDRFAIHKRNASGGFEFERKVDASRALFFGYFDRFDQYRGISPTASAVNLLVSLHQGVDYALAKAKVSQLFAFAIYRNADSVFGGGFDEDGEPTAATEYKVDFTKGPNFLDMDPGDKAEFLESNSPGGETATFWQTVTALALKSLDIPYSFFAEDFTNFFGSRAALNLYLKSAGDKQKDVREFLNSWLSWRLGLALDVGEFEAPVGFSADPTFWDWIPDGLPWWNPTQEMAAAEKAISLKLRSRSELRKEGYGDDWRDVVDELADEEAYLEEVAARRSSRPIENEGE